MQAAQRLTLTALFVISRTLPAFAVDLLPSWNDTAPKKAFVAFVNHMTKEGSPDFVPVAERIAVFDNDGTLWAEQPLYFQFLFAVDRVKALTPQHMVMRMGDLIAQQYLPPLSNALISSWLPKTDTKRSVGRPRKRKRNARPPRHSN